MELNNIERINKVEEILDYVLNHRNDGIIEHLSRNSKRVNVSFTGQIGANVEFSGVRGSVLMEDNKKYKANVTDINHGATHVNLQYLNKKNQYQPLCYIHTARQASPDMNISIDIDFVPFYNSQEFESKNYYLNGQDFDYLKNKAVSKTEIKIQSKQFKTLSVYHSSDENADDLINKINQIISASKVKPVSTQKLSKVKDTFCKEQQKPITAPEINNVNDNLSLRKQIQARLPGVDLDKFYNELKMVMNVINDNRTTKDNSEITK